MNWICLDSAGAENFIGVCRKKLALPLFSLLPINKDIDNDSFMEVLQRLSHVFYTY